MASLTKAAREQYVVDRHEKKKGLILPLAEYQQLMEDLHDLAVVAERREETSISVKELKRRLKQHGRVGCLPQTSVTPGFGAACFAGLVNRCKE